MTTFFTPAQILPAFQYRKSCRHYDPSRKISAEDFNYILELARLSPSSVGSEPWRFLVVQNPELRQKLKPFSWGMAATLDTASHIVVILAKKNARYDSPFMLDGIKRRASPSPKPSAKPSPNTTASKPTMPTCLITSAPCLTGAANKPTSPWPT